MCLDGGPHDLDKTIVDNTSSDVGGGHLKQIRLVLEEEEDQRSPDEGWWTTCVVLVCKKCFQIEGEAERLLESTRANERGSENSRVIQEQDDDRIVDRDETYPYNEVIFGRRRPDSIAIEWTSKTLYILDFRRTSDQRQDYRERGESRARDQHDVLVKSVKIVAKKAEGESAGWTVKLIIFVGGTCGSVHVQTFNSNLKELGVVNRNGTQSGEHSCMSC
jgi:hypothetical protein